MAGVPRLKEHNRGKLREPPGPVPGGELSITAELLRGARAVPQAEAFELRRGRSRHSQTEARVQPRHAAPLQYVGERLRPFVLERVHELRDQHRTGAAQRPIETGAFRKPG